MSLKDFLSTLQRTAVGVGLLVQGAHPEASADCASVGNVGRPHDEGCQRPAQGFVLCVLDFCVTGQRDMSNHTNGSFMMIRSVFTKIFM